MEVIGQELLEDVKFYLGQKWVIMNLIKIISTTYKRLTGAPGKSLNCNVSGLGESECELYSVPGIFAKPADETIGLQINLEFGRIIFATHNYKLNKDINTGETLIYSIDNNGNLKAQGHFDKNGNIILNEGTNSAVKFIPLNLALQNMVTAINANLTATATAITNLGGTYVPVPILLDISGAEVPEVKL